MKNKFVIYMSVFLSLLALGAMSPDTKQGPQVETLQASSPVVVTLPKPTTTTTVPETTTTTPQETTTTEVPTTVRSTPTTVRQTVETAPPPPETVPEPQVEAPPVEAACGPYAMSTGEAHACWDGLIGQYDWSTTTAFRIMYCESNGKYDAYNGSGATGLFQILGGPVDPAANVAAAYDMYSARGWQPWSCH